MIRGQGYSKTNDTIQVINTDDCISSHPYRANEANSKKSKMFLIMSYSVYSHSIVCYRGMGTYSLVDY